MEAAAAAEDVEAVFRLGRPCHWPFRAISIQRPSNRGRELEVRARSLLSPSANLGLFQKVEEGYYKDHVHKRLELPINCSVLIDRMPH